MDYQRAPGAKLLQCEREWLKDHSQVVSAVFPIPTIVNIGILFGASMWCLRAGAPSARLIGIDKDLRRERINPANRIQGMEELEAEFIEGDSPAVGKAFDGPVHMIFVDGCHQYKCVKDDIQAWRPHIVAAHGLIAFHDYNPMKSDIKMFPKIVGVQKAVDELMADWQSVPAVGSMRAFTRY